MVLRPIFGRRNVTSQEQSSASRRGRRARVLRLENLERRAMLSYTPNLGILTLDPTSSGALSKASSGTILVTNGDIVDDSANAKGAIGSGSGNLTASNIYLHGNLSNTGSGHFAGTVYTGVLPLADPLALLPTPSVPAAEFDAPTINGTTVTLSPGVYIGRITIEGNAHVTFQPGLYYLDGGISISGGTVTGSGVTFYNYGSSINISGTANVSLSAPTSGAYQGIVLFQNRTNNRAISIAASAAVALTGDVYAPDAQFQVSGGTATVSGNGSTIPGAVIVRDLSASGGSLTVHANAGGATGDLSITKTDNFGGSSIRGTTGLATAGGTITYTITVANAGPAAALGATVSDSFPTAFLSSDTYTVAATGGAIDLTHSSGSGAISDSVYLPSGSTLTYTVAAHISSTATGQFTNAATVAAPSLFTDSNSANNSASDTDSLLKADLAITDTDGKTSAVPGTVDTYTVVVTNNGPSAVTSATVQDLLAANADIASDSFTVAATGGASDTTHASSGTGSINDSLSMPSGSKITYTISATISATATGTLTNMAAVASQPNVGDPVSSNNSASDNDTLTPQSDLLVTNHDSDSGTIVPGTQVTYTVVVKNSGPSNAVGVTIADALPAGITSDTYTAAGTSGASGFTASGSGNIDDTSVSLTSGACITYTITANVSAASTGSLVTTATAKVGSGETNTNPNQSSGTTSATDTASLTPNVDLAVAVADNVGGTSAAGGATGTGVPGDQIVYTVTVQNSGPSNAVGVAIADSLPASVTADSYTAVGASGSSGFTASGTGNISDAAVNLAAGSSITYTITATIGASATGSLSNSATAKAGSGETNTNSAQSGGTTTATDSDDLSPEVDLVVTKTDNDGGGSSGATGSVVPGNTVTYTVTVQNTGPSNAVGVAVADTLPADVASDTFTAVGTSGASGFSASGTGNIADTSVNIASGASITYTIIACVKGSATDGVSNSATATAGAGETNTNPNAVAGTTTATDADNLTPEVDFVVTQVASGFGTAVPGSQIMYVITVTNAGPSKAVGATIADTFAADIASDTYTASGSADASGFTASGSGNIDDTSVNLAAGASITYVVTANIGSSVTGTLTNTATATVGTGETNIYPNQSSGTTSATDVENLSPQVDLAVNESDDGGGTSFGATGTIVPGDTVTYTITVENAGPSDAVGVAIADTLPAGITSDSYTAIGSGGASGFSASGSGNINDAAVNLASGASITYTVVANIDPSATGMLANTATATAGSGQTNTDVNQSGGTTSATASDNLSAEVDLVVTKTDDGGGSSDGTTGNVSAGGIVTYTITVQNTGPSNAVGVAIADALPTGIDSTIDSAVGTAGTSGYAVFGLGPIADTVNIAAGASITYTVVSNIDALASGEISNTVTATVGSGELNTNPLQSGGITSATDIDSVS